MDDDAATSMMETEASGNWSGRMTCGVSPACDIGYM